MNYLLPAAIFTTGAAGLAAQVLLLRELCLSFFGNELVIGVILANWLFSESAGAFLGGRLSERSERLKNKINLFAALQIAFSLGLFFSLYLARAFKPLAGLSFDAALGLPAIFFSSLLIIFPPAFCHGALFSCGCKIYSVGKAYSWEAIGSLAAGAILSFFLIPSLNSFEIAFVFGMSSLLTALLLLQNAPSIVIASPEGAKQSKIGLLRRSPSLRSGSLLAMTRIPSLRAPKGRSNLFATTVVISLILGVLFLFCGGLNSLHPASIRRQWGSRDILDYRNSVYGNIVVAKDREQYTFFYNGIPAVTAPYPDKQFVEDFGSLPLLFHPAPKTGLIIGGGAGGLIYQVLKHPLASLDYAELDPLLIEMLRKFETPLTRSELGGPRVHISNVDARFFLRRSVKNYDIILIGVSRPSDLATNRFFTKEFFALAKKRLSPGGILSFYLPGSFSYLSRELKNLNRCILDALKDNFNYTRVIPGDYNIFLASDAKEILEAPPALLSQRLAQRSITDTSLLADYLIYRLSPQLADWFSGSMQSAKADLNSDFKPAALFETIAAWNKQFSPKFSHLFRVTENLNLKNIALSLALLFIILSALSRRLPNRRSLTVAYAIFTTGFFGMLSSLILIFAFQVFYGYLYYIIGLLIGLFMAGAASGGALMGGRIEKKGGGLNLFLRLEILIAVFTLAMALILTKLLQPGNFSLFIFLLLFYLCGLLPGLEFPLAVKITGQAPGALYAADLLGGWLAGISAGIIFLPVLGLFDTLMAAALFKLSAILLLSPQKILVDK